jgi:hypothetical protein
MMGAVGCKCCLNGTANIRGTISRYSGWLHPITLTPASISVHDELTDPFIFPWYDGFDIRTFCGRTCSEGAAAIDVLKDELTFLERILNRNLTREIRKRPVNRAFR